MLVETRGPECTRNIETLISCREGKKKIEGGREGKERRERTREGEGRGRRGEGREAGRAGDG